MAFSLHRCRRSRTLTLLSMVAWLMLVTSSLMAAPSANASMRVVPMSSSTMTHCHDAAAYAATSDRACCHGHKGCATDTTCMTCHCALCGAAFLPVFNVTLVSTVVNTLVQQMGATRAPQPNRSPPLRPPVV